MAHQLISAERITLKDVIGDISAQYADIIVSGVALDSRAVKTGDIFFAYPGEASDGRHYIAQAISAGASVIVAEANSSNQSHAVPVIYTTNLREKVGFFAANFYRNPTQNIDVIGITGTNGKTTTCQLLAQLFRGLAGKCGAIGTLGVGLSEAEQQPGLTTPDSINLQKTLNDWREQQVPAAVMEVSSHALDQGRCNGLQFRVAIFTNLSRDHLDYHGDMDRYAEAKAKLFSWNNLEYAFINMDDEFGAKLLTDIPATVSAYGYSIQNADAPIYAQVVEYLGQGMRAKIKTPWGNIESIIPLVGDFNLSNVLSVVACVAAIGYDVNAIAQLLPALKSVAGRMEMFNQYPVTGVVDFAHTPDALEKTLHAIRRHCEGKLWCVFGCGGDRDKGKRPQMAEVATRLADRVIVTSDNPRSESPENIIADILSGAKDDSIIVEIDRAQAIARAVKEADINDVVLVAGKGHEDYQLIGDKKLSFSDRAHLLAQLSAKFSVQDAQINLHSSGVKK